MTVSTRILLLACLVLGGAVSVWLGQDANWDLLNYHLYNGAALLRGRFSHDLLAAGLQSYLNPLLDSVYAWLALGPLAKHPRALAAVMGLWFGVALYLAARLAMLLYRGRPVSLAVAVLLGVTGVAMVSQIGTTTEEVPAAAVMLGGLYWLLRGARSGPPSTATIVAASALFGAAAGLKLTAIVYASAVCLAAASLQPPRRMLVAGFWSASGWLAGFTLVDLWWALKLFRRFGSPTFPMFNGVFRSPWFPPSSVVDDRFLPHGIEQWLFYPFDWLSGGPYPGDLPFRDPRAAIALGCGIAALLAWGLRRPPLAPIQRAALVFLVAGYAAWLATSSIIRYAVVIEVVAGLMVPLLLARVLSGKALTGGLVLLALLAVGSTHYPQAPRVPYGAWALQADTDWVKPGMLIVITFRGPSAHVVAMMPHQDSISVMNVGDTVLEARGWKLQDEMMRRVRDHVGPIAVVTQGNVEAAMPELLEIGLSPTLTNCRAFASTFIPISATGLHVCDGRKIDLPHLPNPFWAEAAQRYRTIMQPAGASQSLIGATYLATVGPAARGTKFVDWTDLLWGGLSHAGAPMPQALDPNTLYVLGPEQVPAISALLDPARDALGMVDGLIVAAPGWRSCAACTAPLGPVRIARPGAALSIGDIALLGPQAAASRYLGRGWWSPDATGAWSQADAELLIPLAPDLPRHSELVLTGTVFTGPGLPTQRVEIEIPGQPASATTQTLSAAGTIRFPIDRDWLQQDADGLYLLPLHLSLPDAAQPLRLGVNTDDRRLGFAPSSVSLEAADR